MAASAADPYIEDRSDPEVEPQALIEAAMLVALGFLSASLLALAAVPALARRADRLARKRAEAAFPLSLAEIAADRDHLRAELAIRARKLEQQAERGFAAKAEAMREVGRRDMTIGERERELQARDARIAAIEGELDTTRGELDETRHALARESAALAETAATLEKRLADLASLEHSLAETRSSLTGTSADLAARAEELERERATLARIEAQLAERETELAAARSENDQLRVAQVEERTRILVLEGKRDELADRLAASERGLAESRAAAQAMTVDRDSERLRADALAARAAQAEAGLAAAEARSQAAAGEAVRIEAELARERQAHAAAREARQAAVRDLGEARAALQALRERMTEEALVLRKDLHERETRLEALHAEVQRLQGALSQARADRARLKREAGQGRKTTAEPAAAEPSQANTALRHEIVKVAEQLMALPPKQEAAE